MPWYGNTIQRQTPQLTFDRPQPPHQQQQQQQQQQQPQSQQGHTQPQQHSQAFGGTPMSPAPSAPGAGFGATGGMTNGVSPYHGPANGAQGSGNADAKAGALVFPALHLHPMNDTFAPKQILLAPPGPDNKVKIGRQTNAKTVPHPSNGYFDSKVLSRMHAEVWCHDGKMFIKDVKSSNGTFINGERLSAEAQESDVFELHNEDLVEFGIDIVGEDNKTIVHHKVACRVYLVFTAEDAMSMRNDYASMYRNTVPSHIGNMPQAGIGPGAEGGLRRGKSTMNFDHILSKLQMELQRSRDTNAEIGSLNSAIGEIQESFGGGLPPLQEAPHQHVVPQPHVEGATNGSGERLPASNEAVESLQAQLAETQSSISTQIDKIRALESMLAEHEMIKVEVGSIKSQMAEAKRELEEMAHSRTVSANGDRSDHLSARGALGATDGDEDDADDGASIASMDTVTPASEADDTNAEDDDSDTDEPNDGHVGPRAPPDLPPDIPAQEAQSVAPVAPSQSAREVSVPSQEVAAHEQARERDQDQDQKLSARLQTLESQLEEAIKFGRTLQTQHNLATEAVKKLEAKVEQLEQEMSSRVDNVHGKITEALEGRFSAWKEQIEVGWKQEKRDWEEERDKLRQVIEAWDQANGKLEEQAAQQLGATTSTHASGSSSRSVDSADGQLGATSLIAGTDKHGRRRSSKSARRRAAKRHLNPTLRALLYKDSHNDFLADEEGSSGTRSGIHDDLSSDEELGGGNSASGGHSTTTTAGSVGTSDQAHDEASTSASSEATASTAGAKSSLFSSDGFFNRASRGTSPDSLPADGDSTGDGSSAQARLKAAAAGGLKGFGKSNSGGSGPRQGFDNAQAITALSAAAVLVGVAAYAALGKDAAPAR
ncbi:unnamed protein product [Parajaminaea phylloscopi]